MSKGFAVRGQHVGRFIRLMLAAAAVGTVAVGWATQALRERAELAPLASTSLLLDVAALDNRLVAVGERGHILVSADDGRTWKQSDVPTRALLTGITMTDGQHGWAVGHDEIILRTRDGGASWERVHAAPEHEKPLLDVWFKDAQRGLAVGAYGMILETNDGGTTWEPKMVHGEDDFHLNQIVAASDGALYIAAESGHLYRSDDGGTTWLMLTSPYEGSFFGLLPCSDGSLMAFGLRGHLFRSADRGRTWEAIPTGTQETLTTAIELGSGHVVLAGMAGTLVLFDGVDRPARVQELPDRKAIMALAAGRDGSLLLFGEGGVQRIALPR